MMKYELLKRSVRIVYRFVTVPGRPPGSRDAYTALHTILDPSILLPCCENEKGRYSRHAERIHLMTEDVIPRVIKGVSIDGGDQACGNAIIVGNLIQPAISCFQFDRDGLHLDTLMPSQGNGTGQRIMLEIDDISGQSRAAFPVALFVLFTSRTQFSLTHNEFA
jgi:hypothetical protein